MPDSPQDVKCRGCNKSRGVIKYYCLADDLENPKPYHPSCMRKLDIEVMMKLSDINLAMDGKKLLNRDHNETIIR